MGVLSSSRFLHECSFSVRYTRPALLVESSHKAELVKEQTFSGKSFSTKAAIYSIFIPCEKRFYAVDVFFYKHDYFPQD